MSTPRSQIHVCKGVPLNNRYDHTFYFSDETEQIKYFMSKVDRSFLDYTYIRRTWSLKVGAKMEAARQWSYLYFTNAELANKVYFYFVNRVEYVNDNTVELFLELDVIQTYMFDWQMHPCYVEREHSATDNPGDNLVDEGLEVGDYVTWYSEKIDLSQMAIMVAATLDIFRFYTKPMSNEDGDPIMTDKEIEAFVDTIRYYATTTDNLFSGFMIFAVDLATYAKSLTYVLEKLNKHGYIDSVFTMWLYPKALVQSDYDGLNFSFCEYVRGSKELEFIPMITEASMLDGYKPKNNKLLQYPYCFMYATNNNGSSAIYKYHDFFNYPRFAVQGNIGADATVKLIPRSHNGNDYDHPEALAMSGFPLCSWNNDPYKLWLAQNQNQLNTNMGMSALKIVGGAALAIGGAVATGASGGAAAAGGVAAVGSGVGMIASGASDIASQLAQKADKDIEPPQARGTFSSSHNVSRGLQNFNIYHKTIRSGQAKILDEYFTMYGYATRRVKTPNISARPAFNYVKTVGSNITGDFCMEDIKLINALFDKGITFWKSRDIGNYTQDNAPIGG